jgi:glycosyltransferase involved in cell wall biosynthesis
MKSKVSIIMPVLNGERYITEALDSIVAQTYKNYELVAVNDGSTDRTRDLLYQYADKIALRYVHHPTRQGITASMNDGIRNSGGEYVTFLDHDDLWLPEFLGTHVQHLEAHPDVGMVHCDFQTIDSNGNVIEESVARGRDRLRPSGWVFRQLFMDSFIAASSALIRKECFDRLGVFNETLHWGDYHMWLRIARHYQIDYCPKVMEKYRQHGGQSTQTYNGQPAGKESVAMLAIKELLNAYPEIRQELGEKTIRRRMAMLYFDMAYNWLWRGAPHNARICAGQAIRRWPVRPGYYALYAVSLLPPSGARAVRRGWHWLRAPKSVDRCSLMASAKGASVVGASAAPGSHTARLE